MNHSEAPTNGELHEQLEQIRGAFTEHEKEHKALSRRLNLFLAGAITIAAAYGVWVGSMENRVTETEKDVANAATRVELAAAIANIDTKIENIETSVGKIEQGQEKILNFINKL